MNNAFALDIPSLVKELLLRKYISNLVDLKGDSWLLLNFKHPCNLTIAMDPGLRVLPVLRVAK